MFRLKPLSPLWFRSFVNSLVIRGADGVVVVLPRFQGLTDMEPAVERAYREIWPDATLHFIDADVLTEVRPAVYYDSVDRRAYGSVRQADFGVVDFCQALLESRLANRQLGDGHLMGCDDFVIVALRIGRPQTIGAIQSARGLLQLGIQPTEIGFGQVIGSLGFLHGDFKLLSVDLKKYRVLRNA